MSKEELTIEERLRQAENRLIELEGTLSKAVQMFGAMVRPLARRFHPFEIDLARDELQLPDAQYHAARNLIFGSNHHGYGLVMLHNYWKPRSWGHGTQLTLHGYRNWKQGDPLPRDEHGKFDTEFTVLEDGTVYEQSYADRFAPKDKPGVAPRLISKE